MGGGPLPWHGGLHAEATCVDSQGMVATLTVGTDTLVWSGANATYFEKGKAYELFVRPVGGSDSVGADSESPAST